VVCVFKFSHMLIHSHTHACIHTHTHSLIHSFTHSHLGQDGESEARKSKIGGVRAALAAQEQAQERSERKGGMCVCVDVCA
jgi:hypothetical protein